MLHTKPETSWNLGDYPKEQANNATENLLDYALNCNFDEDRKIELIKSQLQDNDKVLNNKKNKTINFNYDEAKKAGPLRKAVNSNFAVAKVIIDYILNNQKYSKELKQQLFSNMLCIVIENICSQKLDITQQKEEKNSQKEILDYLLTFRAFDLTIKNNNDYNTPLHIAIKSDNTFLIEQILLNITDHGKLAKGSALRQTLIDKVTITPTGKIDATVAFHRAISFYKKNQFQRAEMELLSAMLYDFEWLYKLMEQQIKFAHKKLELPYGLDLNNYTYLLSFVNHIVKWLSPFLGIEESSQFNQQKEKFINLVKSLEPNHEGKQLPQPHLKMSFTIYAQPSLIEKRPPSPNNNLNKDIELDTSATADVVRKFLESAIIAYERKVILKMHLELGNAISKDAIFVAKYIYQKTLFAIEQLKNSKSDKSDYRYLLPFIFSFQKWVRDYDPKLYQDFYDNVISILSELKAIKTYPSSSSSDLIQELDTVQTCAPLDPNVTLFCTKEEFYQLHRLISGESSSLSLSTTTTTTTTTTSISRDLIKFNENSDTQEEKMEQEETKNLSITKEVGEEPPLLEHTDFEKSVRGQIDFLSSITSSLENKSLDTKNQVAKLNKALNKEWNEFFSLKNQFERNDRKQTFLDNCKYHIKEAQNKLGFTSTSTPASSTYSSYIPTVTTMTSYWKSSTKSEKLDFLKSSLENFLKILNNPDVTVEKKPKIPLIKTS